MTYNDIRNDCRAIAEVIPDILQLAKAIDHSTNSNLRSSWHAADKVRGSTEPWWRIHHFILDARRTNDVKKLRKVDQVVHEAAGVLNDAVRECLRKLNVAHAQAIRVTGGGQIRDDSLDSLERIEKRSQGEVPE